MVSPQSIREKGPNIYRVAVGTGPFKFVEWIDNASFKLVRNENTGARGSLISTASTSASSTS